MARGTCPAAPPPCGTLRRAGGVRHCIRIRNIAALQITLSPDQTRRLTDASALIPGFTDGLGSVAVQRMIFGGQTVQGWR